MNEHKERALGDRSGADKGDLIRQREMEDAALQPFADVGLRKVPISPLLSAITTPYEVNVPFDCASVGAAILALDSELGPDLDVKLAEQRKKGMSEKGAIAAGDALVDAVESSSTSIIPLRGLVRKVSGASDHERRVAAAIQAGKLRRAYLKGIGQTLGCQPPAAPLPYKPS